MSRNVVVSDRIGLKQDCTATIDGSKIRIWKEEGSYYPCNENKGADQLRSNQEGPMS